jgi:hypothetical protein
MPLEQLTPEAFEKLFGITLPTPLTTEKREECAAINTLFDDMRGAFGLESCAIFSEVLKDDAFWPHSKFLRDVSSCPDAVISFCQKELAHNTERRRKFSEAKTEKEREKTIRIPPLQFPR